MKKTAIICGFIFLLLFVAYKINFFGQILSLLIIGFIPYTQIRISPLAMFAAWLLLPLFLFATVQAIKGLLLLTLIAFEKIEYGVKSHIDTAKATKTPTIFTRVKKSITCLASSVRKRLKQLPRFRYGKVGDFNKIS